VNVARTPLIALLLATTLSAQTPQQPPVFKGGTRVIPLTVTVLDARGQPVKDLKPSDFTVIENKQVREIVNFFPQQLTPSLVPSAPVEAAANRVRDDLVEPQTRRTFLIVLGYGRIEKPTNALEGAADFVRQKLLPQDAVAVMGFHRVSNFTIDHEAVAQMLDRYRKDHEKLCFDIDNYLVMSRGGPGQGGGGAPIPRQFLQRADEIFLGPPAPSGATPSSVTVRNSAELLLAMNQGPKVVDKPGQQQETLTDILTSLRDSGDELRDAVLVSTRLKLYAGIEYLRYLDGDKHMVFFTGRGLAYNKDDAQIVAKRATDARVVVDVIATNGTARPLAGTQMAGSLPVPLIAAPAGGGDPAGRVIAELSGGYYTSAEMATKAAGKIDQATRFSYLLGYVPSNPELDGRYRDVEVKVNRPDVTVRYRHGYFAAEQPEPLELKDLLVKARLETALAIEQQAEDIPITASAVLLPKMGIQTEVRVDVTIGAAPLGLLVRDGVRVGQLELQVYIGDLKEVATGSFSARLELKAGDEQYQQWLQTGIRRTMRVASAGPPKFVKVIVYDYGSDKVGTALVNVK
jgi:VWFA-related protein